MGSASKGSGIDQTAASRGKQAWVILGVDGVLDDVSSMDPSARRRHHGIFVPDHVCPCGLVPEAE